MTIKLGVPSKGRLMEKTFDWFGARGVTLSRTGSEREYAGTVGGVDGVDLVLLDIMLPELDGFEVCRRIKSNSETKHIPVVMLTAKKSREDMARGEQVGADWYITKPFKSAMVIETIQRFID